MQLDTIEVIKKYLCCNYHHLHRLPPASVTEASHYYYYSPNETNSTALFVQKVTA